MFILRSSGEAEEQMHTIANDIKRYFVSRKTKKTRKTDGFMNSIDKDPHNRFATH